MASTHIYPTTQTRLAGELTALVRAMREIDKDAPQLQSILQQVASGDDYASVAKELGFPETTDGIADATAAYNLIGSLVHELQNSSPFWKQVISRMG
jgi:hypothetical protein